MLGLALLLGHLLGDYIFQNDFMAQGKTSRRSTGDVNTHWCRPHLICALHCIAYTVGVYAAVFPVHSFPWWFYTAVAAIHWPVDRYSLAMWWMTKISGQAAFATGPCSPWSIIVVDNVFHLLTLYVLALAAGVN